MISLRKIEIAKEIKVLQTRIRKLGPIMRGSVTIMENKNKQPYFSVRKGGKTKVVYLDDKRAAKAKMYTENYKVMISIIDEMTLLQMELLKLEGKE